MDESQILDMLRLTEVVQMINNAAEVGAFSAVGCRVVELSQLLLNNTTKLSEAPAKSASIAPWIGPLITNLPAIARQDCERNSPVTVAALQCFAALSLIPSLRDDVLAAFVGLAGLLDGAMISSERARDRFSSEGLRLVQGSTVAVVTRCGHYVMNASDLLQLVDGSVKNAVVALNVTLKCNVKHGYCEPPLVRCLMKCLHGLTMPHHHFVTSGPNASPSIIEHAIDEVSTVIDCFVDHAQHEGVLDAAINALLLPLSITPAESSAYTHCEACLASSWTSFASFFANMLSFSTNGRVTNALRRRYITTNQGRDLLEAVLSRAFPVLIAAIPSGPLQICSECRADGRSPSRRMENSELTLKVPERSEQWKRVLVAGTVALIRWATMVTFGASATGFARWQGSKAPIAMAVKLGNQYPALVGPAIALGINIGCITPPQDTTADLSVSWLTHEVQQVLSSASGVPIWQGVNANRFVNRRVPGFRWCAQCVPSSSSSHPTSPTLPQETLSMHPTAATTKDDVVRTTANEELQPKPGAAATATASSSSSHSLLGDLPPLKQHQQQQPSPAADHHQAPREKKNRSEKDRAMDCVGEIAAISTTPIPPQYRCAMHGTLMANPVRLPSGYVYDLHALEEVIEEIGHVDPVTAQPFSCDLVVDKVLQREIAAFRFQFHLPHYQ